MDENVNTINNITLNDVYYSKTTFYCVASMLGSLKGLENCVNLQEIFCCGNYLRSLKGLENCTKLEKLWCGNNKLTSFKGLENCVT